MASSTTSPISLSSPSSSTLVDAKAAPRHTASSQCVTLPTLPPLAPAAVHSQTTSRAARTTAYCRKIARNVMAMATGEVTTAEVATTELPEFVKTIQKTWEKVEDKYAVTSLAVAGAVGLWASAGVVAALDKLPVVPGFLEVVGIGYTGVFVYNNLVYKPDREALIQKVKDTYKEILGTN
nr:protein CURVATURE THYLAKOID 1B, chloroplastic [Ipomoea trifida]